MNVEKLLKKVSQSLSVSRAFGTAYESGETMVIPVAFIAGGGGAGEGTATGGSPSEDHVDLENEDFDDDAEPTSGSGGGFGGTVMPVGAYVINDDDVRWVPAINANLLIIVGLIALRMVLRAVRPR